MSNELEILQDFKFKIQIQIAWIDMDLYGHVNNVNYLRYFESARMRYLENFGFYDEYKKSGLAAVISKNTCNYLTPLIYPELITVGARITEIQDDLILMEHFITRGDNSLSAFGETEMVIYDFKLAKRVKIPQLLAEKIRAFENM